MTDDVVVLAGGKGTRLAGAIGETPKALAEIAGRPFLDWLFAYLEGQPVGRIVLSVGYLADQIVSRYGTRFGRMPIVYARETSPLGTGGAIRHAMATARCTTAYVLNGDTLLPIPLGMLQGTDDEDLVVAVRNMPDASRYGRVRCEGDHIAAFAEKSASGAGLVNAGTYWVHRRLFARAALPQAFSFEHDLLQPLAGQLRARAVVAEAPFIDIGTPASLVDAQVIVPALAALAANPAPTA